VTLQPLPLLPVRRIVQVNPEASEVGAAAEMMTLLSVPDPPTTQPPPVHLWGEPQLAVMLTGAVLDIVPLVFVVGVIGLAGPVSP
jgi:hypothetical protein